MVPARSTAVLALRLGCLTAAYIAVAWLSLSVAFIHGTVSPVWPVTGLGIAALTLWGVRLWPAITIGAIVVNAVSAGDPLPAVCGIAIGNTLEAACGAWALRRLGVKGEVSRVRDGIAFIAVAVLAPVLSASVGVLSLTLAGASPWERYGWVWLAWWLGDFMGALLFTPLLLAWLGERSRADPPPRPVEFAGAVTMAAVMVSFVFLRPQALAALDVPYLPLSSFLFPPIVWAVLRLRPRETTTVVVVACAISVGYTVSLPHGNPIGQLLWLQMVLLCIGGGSLLMAGAMVERAQALQEQRANEIRFRTIFEQAAVGISQVGLDGRLLEVNRRLCEMLGYRRDELLDKTFEELTEPHFRDDERHALDSLLAGRCPRYVIEKQYLRKGGAPVWVRVTSSLPEQAEQTEPAYRISIVEDIGKQQQAMAAVQEAHAQLQFALEGARAGLWEWDVAADRLTCSEAYRRLTGFGGEAPTTFDAWLATLDPDDRTKASEAVRTTFARKDRRFRLEFRIRHPDKGLCWLMGLAQVTYAEDGRPLRMVGLNVEVTDLKRAEEEAQAANRAKTMFLAAASHDLRQPVQAALLLSSVVTARLEGHPAQPLMAKIGTSLDALQRLLGGLLDISRLDAGVVAPEIQTVPLADIVERLRVEYAPRAAERRLSLRVVRTSASIRTDPALLERILRNLIENALRYTERGKVLIGARRRGDTVRLHVIDTGIGIPRDQQEAIFQEFYQVGNPERDREKGLGLGLAIVKRLCALLGHRLDFVSQPGQGTHFVIDLPAVWPEMPRMVPIRRAEPPPSRLAILVIDDDVMVREGMAAILQDWGYEVLPAANASEAVAQVSPEGCCPHAILADYRLRDRRTGIEAAKEVHRVCGRAIPAIIITGDTAPDRIAEAKASGFQLMHKPVQPESLRRIIATLRP